MPFWARRRASGVNAVVIACSSPDRFAGAGKGIPPRTGQKELFAGHHGCRFDSHEGKGAKRGKISVPPREPAFFAPSRLRVNKMASSLPA
jgi:hypothetical protein